jgi:hypothetical protein
MSVIAPTSEHRMTHARCETLPLRPPPSRLARARALAIVTIVAVLAGCATTGGRVREQLDTTTGMTVTSDARPIVYAKTEARYSRSARDYVYLGPVETNRQGVRDYYLWVGIGTTIDRGYLAPPLELPDTLYGQIGGEFMEFPLRQWEDIFPVSRRTAVYAPGVAMQTQLAARVTLYQLQLLARAAPSSVRLGTNGTTTQPYVRWDDAEPWRGFLVEIGADAPVVDGSDDRR